MNKDYALIDNVLSIASTMDGAATPTHSSMTEIPSDYVESVPYPGADFIIRLRDTNKYITLVNGNLELTEGLNPKGGYHWECIERDRWLGFRNCVSGTLIGHNNRKRFVAQVVKHQSYEFFTLRPSPQGGYELLTKHDFELWSMTVDEDGKTLVEDPKGPGALWDFLKV